MAMDAAASLQQCLRSSFLNLLKHKLTPEQRASRSAALCSNLQNRFDTFMSTRTASATSSATHYCSSGCSSSSSRHQGGYQRQQQQHQQQPAVVMCLYLPLSFEPDVLPFVKYLWSRRGKGGHSSSRIDAAQRTPSPFLNPNIINFVPHITSATEMVFVEVHDEEDLERNFRARGKFGIREMLPECWEKDVISQYDWTADGASSSPRSWNDNSENNSNNKKKRRVLGKLPPPSPPAPLPPTSTDACDTTTTTSTSGAAATTATSARCGNRWRRRISPLSATTTITDDITTAASDGAVTPTTPTIIVLCPASAFDTQCNRLGKGGGYYDRFLAALAQEVSRDYAMTQDYSHSSSDNADYDTYKNDDNNNNNNNNSNNNKKSDCNHSDKTHLYLWGVGFEEQVLGGEENKRASSKGFDRCVVEEVANGERDDNASTTAATAITTTSPIGTTKTLPVSPHDVPMDEVITNVNRYLRPMRTATTT